MRLLKRVIAMKWRIDLTVLSNMLIDFEAETEKEAIELFYADLSEDELRYIKINSVGMVQ